MPTAPRSHRPAHYQPPAEQRREQDRRRLTSRERGYSARWDNYAKALRQERAICELCMEASGTVTPAADKRTGMVDHTIPVDSADDPLFWEPTNHRVLCIVCDRWKSNVFDGGFSGKEKSRPSVRSIDGVAMRWAEVVAARRGVGCAVQP